MRRRWMGLALGAAVTLRVAGPVLADDFKYVGDKKCKGCHSYQYKIWKESKHAEASQVMKDERKKDRNCVKCHTTGADQGIFLEGVQCEACHGPGSLYKSPKVMNKGRYKSDPEGQRKMAVEAGLAPQGEEVCLKCHIQQRPEGHAESKPFNFDEAYSRIDHRKKE